MQASSYLQKALFYDQTPAIHEFFEQKAAQLFLQPKEKTSSLVELHVLQTRRRRVSDDGFTIMQQYQSDLKQDSESNTDLFNDSDGIPLYNGAPVERWRITNNDELKYYATKSKQRFRICFLHQRHSYSRLLVTAAMFNTLMTEFHIFPRFKEFILLFGSKHGDNEVAVPQLRFRRGLASTIAPLGQHHSDFGTAPYSMIWRILAMLKSAECAYGLKYVELNNRSSRKPWSIRQTAIYHQYAYKNDRHLSTWLLVAPSERTKQLVETYVKESSDLLTLNPFEIHLVILDASLANWRPYIVYLTEQITEQVGIMLETYPVLRYAKDTNFLSDKLVVASIDEKNPVQLLNFEERQILKDFEDLLIDNLLVLDTTLDTISSLLDNYQSYWRISRLQSREMQTDDVDLISVALQEQKSEVSSSRRKIETLHRKVQGSIKLLSSLLDLGNGNSLKELAEEAREENTTMRKLAEKSTKDAAAVKVLTIITLIYLPATVVSNFFSTQFVSQEQGAEGSIKIIVSSNAWLFAAISVPLTLATLVVWWLWVRLQAHGAGAGPRLHSLWRKPIATDLNRKLEDKQSS